MPFFEVIFETGEHSIMQADDQSYILSFANTHHARAKAGLPGGPAGYPAERVVRILTYDEDPAELSASPFLSKDVAASTIKQAASISTEDGVLDVNAFIHEMAPVAIVDTEAHESNYSAAETGEIDPSLWGGESE